MRTGLIGKLDKARRRIDVARCANGYKKITTQQRRFYGLHLKRHLAEPDDVRSQRAAPTTTLTAVFNSYISTNFEHLPTALTTHLEQLTMHVDQMLTAPAFVQVVDVLGDQ